MELRTANPLGLKARADYDLSVVTRAYVGKIRDNPAMTASEMEGGSSEPVFVFPKRGEKYHSKGCGFLTAASTSGVLTGSIRAKYRPCPLCGSGRASSGARIYYFPSAGEAYHLSGCSALQRNYVEIDKKDAIERGYTPCSKCGG
jgi:ribosomal protein S27AE